MTIYFVETTNSDAFIKIGHTENIDKRWKNAKSTDNPYPIKILTTTPGDTSDEYALHTMFSDARISGEWFRRDPALLSLIEKLKNGMTLDHLFGRFPDESHTEALDFHPMDIKEREIKRVKHNVIHLHVDDAWKKEIERLAEAHGETISETIRECVRLGAQAFHDKRSKRKPFAE